MSKPGMSSEQSCLLQNIRNILLFATI